MLVNAIVNYTYAHGRSHGFGLEQKNVFFFAFTQCTKFIQYNK